MKTIKTTLILFSLLFLSVFMRSAVAQNERPSGMSETDTIYVAPPTGKQETDRASIQAAVEQVEPGGTIQFAPGTYLIGAGIRIEVARLTLRGHPQGTTLRGCDPVEFATFALSELSENCDGLRLLAGHQSVYDLTFEYAFTGLHLGLMWETDNQGARSEGGDRIMNNTFRTGKGVLLEGDWSEPSVIQNNRFINNYHAVNIFGATAHVLDNYFSVPEPERVPIAGFPDEAIRIFPRDRKTGVTMPAVCGRNVVAGNRIEGSLIGIEIRVPEADASCNGNVIRDNWIAVTPAHVPDWSDYGAPDDNRFVYGVALALNNLAAESSGSENKATAPRISGNVIEGNRIVGGSGPAIQLYGAAGNRIVANTITGIQLRETYPGHTLGFPTPGTDANGSGIWLSPGSNGNEIENNSFKDIASNALFMEGDNNLVQVKNPADSIRDLGTGNKVIIKNDSVDPLYESKFVETRGIRLQYMDFGGEGLPVIFLQDYHDYFSIDEEEAQHSAWLARFADEYRVLAPVRRGWGESDDTGYGYDVATQAEDLLGLMDALEIERAVMVGRIPANQDMTWIAEHHPERVAGLIYVGNPRISTFSKNPDIMAFNENYVRGVCDVDTDEAEKWEKRTGARQDWRPHFFSDPEARINISTLRFYDPVWEEKDLSLWRLEPERIKKLALSNNCGDEQAQQYFKELALDENRLKNLRQTFLETDPSQKLNETIERAFGSSMKTVVEEGLKGADEMYDSQFPYMIKFLQRIEQKEK